MTECVHFPVNSASILDNPIYKNITTYHSQFNINFMKEALHYKYSCCLSTFNLPNFYEMGHNFSLTPLDLNFGYVVALTLLVPSHFDLYNSSYLHFTLDCPVCSQKYTLQNENLLKIETWVKSYKIYTKLKLTGQAFK